MTINEYVDLLVGHPALRMGTAQGVFWTGDEAAKRTACERAVEIAAHMIGSEYDFPFALGEHTETIPANTSEIVLQGESDDLRDIINIRLTAGSTANQLLVKETLLDFDRRRSGQTSSLTTVTYWAVLGQQGDFPKIVIDGTPTADTGIAYRYRKIVTPTMIPNSWAGTLVDVALGEMIADWRGFGRMSLRRMVDEYSRKGGEESRVPMDSQIRRRNNERNKIISGY